MVIVEYKYCVNSLKINILKYYKLFENCKLQIENSAKPCL